MRTRVAVLWEAGGRWTVEEADLAEPGPDEVRVRLAAAGLCHSDEHLVTRDMQVPLPVVGGHEGAGVVDAVGSAVTTVAPGDHVVLGFMPICGRCRWCSVGRQNLCDFSGQIFGDLASGRRRWPVRVGGSDVGTMCLLGTFAEHCVINETSVIRIDPDIPLAEAALVGCGVTTGWGSAVYAADVRPGETVVVVGIGGVGINAVQGAAFAGAQHVVAVDPVDFKRQQAAEFGATHVAADLDEAREIIADLTGGAMADKAIIAVGGGRASAAMIAPVMALAAKGSRTIVATVSPQGFTDVQLDLHELTVLEKDLRGSLFGTVNPRMDIPRLLGLYRAGRLRLDEQVTRRYKLDEINDGYEDMRSGRNLRGVVVFD